MSITALPTPPTRDDPENFAARADAFLAALPPFAQEANVMAQEVEVSRAICQSAAQTVNVSAWVSGTTYAEGVNCYDPVDFLTYRRKVAGAGTTRPGLDATNWQLLTGFGNVTLDTPQTITGTKTFTETVEADISGSAVSASTATTATNCTRTVSGAGLASGGGALTGNQVITVNASSQAQAEGGTDNSTAMTPLRTAQAIAALTPPPSTSAVLAATAGASGGVNGSYVFAVPKTSSPDNTTYDIGATVAGSNLNPCGIQGKVVMPSSTALSGTWRSMGWGRKFSDGDGTYYTATLWLRIA